MLKRISFIVLVFTLVVVRPDSSGASPVLSISGNRMIVIMPARQRILQLGFDLLTLRSRLVLISYQGTSDGDDLTMHLWNGNTWLPLSEQDYEAGRFLKADVRVEQVYLIGPEDDVPWVLQYRPLWADDMHWVQSLHIPDIVNVMGDRFRFTRQEWQRMAAWHDLRLYETTVRHRHVQREETWRETSPDEARRPLLERLGGSPATPTRPMPDPVRIERQPWTEVTVQPSPPDLMPEEQPAATDPRTDRMPVDTDTAPLDDATPTVTDSEEELIELEMPQPIQPIETDDESKTTVTVIDSTQDETPKAPLPADPEIDDTAPMAPLMEDDLKVITPEPAAEAHADVADDGIDMEKGMDPVPPVETEPAQPTADTVDEDTVEDKGTHDLTPEEAEFFRLIREEFPDLDDLPDLP